MALITWSESLVTGLEVVDRQHRGLVDMVNSAAPVLAKWSSNQVEDAGPLLDGLLDYAAVHFRTEEDLMAQRGLDQRARFHHMATHQSFVEQVTAMVASYRAGQGVDGDQLLSFLAGWLIFHIQGEDQAMARQIAAVDRGLSAADAYATTDGDRLDPDHEALTRTLVNLYIQLTGQNRELEDHRQHLETLVAARTAELEATAAELRTSRDAAEAGNQAKTRFLERISHELRTPMNAVLGFSRLLGTQGLQPDQEASLRHIVDASEHLLQLINDLIEYSRLQDAPPVAEDATFDLREVVGQACAKAFAAAREKGLQARLEFGPGVPPRLRGDSRRLGAILRHLAENSVKFTERGEVTLQVGRRAEAPSTEPGKVDLSFQFHDTGVGISKEDQARIFTAFDQLDGSSTRRYSGVGLGLTLVKQLTDLLHGHLTLSSEPGKGSRFRVELSFGRDDEVRPPAAPPRDKAASSSPAPAERHSPAAGPLSADLHGKLAALAALIRADDTRAIALIGEDAAFREALGNDFDAVAKSLREFDYAPALKRIETRLRS